MDKRYLSIQNKQHDIVQDADGTEWVQCHRCFASFHLRCLAKMEGEYLNQKIIYRFKREAFICVKCSKQTGVNFFTL